ncbi:MAG: formylglycine-generating enzyme family protein [Candidatus Cloacimonadaceae bacterium]|nr:formylglycine-generating enzyme family protein [Candidatus Cloacimonadaceae bacterium]MDP3113212.1 formylglycine-generating enzyme family protein [Candidatus Cloacimonadaceae bacterium]
MKKLSPLLMLLIMMTIVSCMNRELDNPMDPNNVLVTPTFSPAGGTYPTAQSVTLSCATSGATIRYTINNTEPTATSTVYSSPLTVSSATTIKAKAFKTGWTDSAIASATYTIGSIPVQMIYVPGGTFSNGTSNVTLSNFYIGKYEVTQTEYQAVMGSNPSNFHSVTNGPVERATWFNAIEYCNRRSMNEGLTPCYSYLTYGTNPMNWSAGWNTNDDNHTNVTCSWTANGYRLPTEMEWMFAARGGNQSNNYTYSGSNDINTVAWYFYNSGDTTHTVGTKAANELGTFDMTGNVWEWVWDIRGSYPSGSQTNPTGASSGPDRVVRGGSWDNSSYPCPVSYRNDYHATYSAYAIIGFRVCRVSP